MRGGAFQRGYTALAVLLTAAFMPPARKSDPDSIDRRYRNTGHEKRIFGFLAGPGGRNGRRNRRKRGRSSHQRA